MGGEGDGDGGWERLPTLTDGKIEDGNAYAQLAALRAELVQHSLTSVDSARLVELEELHARAEEDRLQGQNVLHHSYKAQLAALRAELAQHSQTSVDSARLIELEQLHTRAEEDRMQQNALNRSHEAQLAALSAELAQYSLTSVDSLRARAAVWEYER